MGKNRKITRFAAGILSFALAFGAVGNVPPLRIRNASAIPPGYYGETEYEAEIKDAFISRIEEDDGRYRMYILLLKDDYYSYYDRIEITLSSPDIRGGYYLDEEDKPFYEKWEKTREYLDLIDEGTVVSLTFATYEEEEINALKDKLAEEGGYWGSSHESNTKEYFDMDFITGLKSLSVHYYGDINDDGVVDSFDTVTYRKKLAGTLEKPLSEAQFLNADINLNDKIDEEDLQLVNDYLLGNTKEFNGYSDIGSIRLDNTVDIEASEGKVTDKEFAKAEMKLGVDLLKNCFDPTKKDEENLLLSPVSISTALSMTANGADGETREEMEKVLGSGLTLDQLNEYMAYYISKLPNEKKQKVLIADSIWFKDKSTFKVLDDFLGVNKKYYNAQIYKAAFDDSTVKDVNSWVNQNTNGMIPKLLNNGALTPDDKKEILMMLINTLYFEADWQYPYDESYDSKFTDLNGEKHDIKAMYSQESQYFDLGDADAFKKPYAGGNYSFVGIMPKEKDVVEYIKDLDADKLFEGLQEYEDPSTIELKVMIPKFKYSYNKTLADVLSDMGIHSAFSMKNADFSKINDMTVEDAPRLYIDDVLHKTKIEVTEKGTKAAAVTAVMMGAASGIPPEKKKVKIYLDKPFVYMIVDKNNVPLFIGAATELEEGK